MGWIHHSNGRGNESINRTHLLDDKFTLLLEALVLISDMNGFGLHLYLLRMSLA